MGKVFINKGNVPFTLIDIVDSNTTPFTLSDKIIDIISPSDGRKTVNVSTRTYCAICVKESDVANYTTNLGCRRYNSEYVEDYPFDTTSSDVSTLNFDGKQTVNGTSYLFNTTEYTYIPTSAAAYKWNIAIINTNTGDLIPYVEIKTYNIVNNCLYLSDFSPETVTENESVTISLYAKVGYTFDTNNMPIATMGNTTYNFVIDSENNRTCNCTITSVTNDITISGSAILHISNNIVNTSFIIEPKTGNVTITCNTNEGYLFNGDVQLSYTVETDVGGYRTVTSNFTVNDAKTSATITYDFTNITFYGGAQINGTAVLNPDIPSSSYKFINVYKLTSEELENLSKVRFTRYTPNEGLQYIDLGYYVTSLKRFYCNIPTVGNVQQEIVLADISTGVTCSLVSSDYTTADCGIVKIENNTQNSNDYTNTIIEAFLPFVGSVSLETDKYMNRNINLIYIFGIISGKCCAVFKDNDTSAILDIFNGEIAEDVPYILNNIAYQMLGNLSPIESVIYGQVEKNPKIFVTYRDNLSEDNTILFSTSLYSKLSELSGLNIIDHIDITINDITNDEIDLIISVLNDGVIF